MFCAYTGSLNRYIYIVHIVQKNSNHFVLKDWFWFENVQILIIWRRKKNKNKRKTQIIIQNKAKDNRHGINARPHKHEFEYFLRKIYVQQERKKNWHSFNLIEVSLTLANICVSITFDFFPQSNISFCLWKKKRLQSGQLIGSFWSFFSFLQIYH